MLSSFNKSKFTFKKKTKIARRNVRTKIKYSWPKTVLSYLWTLRSHKTVGYLQIISSKLPSGFQSLWFELSIDRMIRTTSNRICWNLSTLRYDYFWFCLLDNVVEQAVVSEIGKSIVVVYWCCMSFIYI